MVPYSAGVHTYKVHTPSRKRAIKRLHRKSYGSTASALVNSPTAHSIITKLAIKIKGEMKAVCSRSHDSDLQDSLETVTHFDWETVRLEFQQKLPTLMSLLSQVTGQASKRSPLICLLASMILKSRHQRMGLIQRAVSVMLYGNGTAKQVS